MFILPTCFASLQFRKTVKVNLSTPWIKLIIKYFHANLLWICTHHLSKFVWVIFGLEKRIDQCPCLCFSLFSKYHTVDPESIIEEDLFGLESEFMS